MFQVGAQIKVRKKGHEWISAEASCPSFGLKVALYSFFSLLFMFKSRQATASAVGPIVTKIGMMIPYTTKYRCSPIYVPNSQNPGYKFAQKIL